MRCEIPDLIQPEGIAVDSVHRMLFWADSGKDKIETSGLDGSNRRVLIDSGLVNPRAIIVDAKSGSVRCSGFAVYALLHIPLCIHQFCQATNRRTQINAFKWQLETTVFICFRSVYWTDWNRDAPKIESSSLDGRNRKVLVQVGLMLPNALTWDFVTNQLCWADAGKCLLKL